MHWFLTISFVVLVTASQVLVSSAAFAGWRRRGNYAVYMPPAPAATAAHPQSNRQYTYQPGMPIQGSAYRSFSYMPNASPGQSYVGPMPTVRGAASKANFNYAPYRGFGAPPQ